MNRFFMLTTFLNRLMDPVPPPEPEFENGVCWEGTDIYCTSCNFEKMRCGFCAYAYRNSETGQCVKPKKCISNCLTYVSETECRDCNVGTKLTPQGVCETIPLDEFPCAVSNSDGECYGCFNYNMVEGKCVNEPCEDPHCMVCQEGGCYQCKTSHVMINYEECVPWVVNTAWNHCYDTDGGDYCVDCDQGYYNDNGVCKRNLVDNRCEAWNINTPTFEDYTEK